MEPFTVDELLSTGRAVLEPLFHEPPLGPVPDYLLAHGSVYGCVAEYEEKLEELDRWKVQQLTRWLSDRIGTHWKDAGRVVELHMEAGAEAAINRFRIRRVEDPSE
jgi:hypothetical protein